MNTYGMNDPIKYLKRGGFEPVKCCDSQQACKGYFCGWGGTCLENMSRFFGDEAAPRKAPQKTGFPEGGP